MKRFVCIIMFFLMLAPLCVFASDDVVFFSDVKETDYYLNASTTLEKLGILAGYPDGTFGAEKAVTRAEMAAIVCRMIDKESDSEKLKDKTDFSDVKSDHWASGYINISSEEGIINGYPNGKFEPESDVKYEEAIKMIVCALGFGKEVSIDKADWSKGYIEVADEKGISADLKGVKGAFATRGDIAVMAYNALATKENSKIPTMPEASKEAGEYEGTQKVKLTTETKGATVYYTKDGTIPTEKSNKYVMDISITETCTLKAVAIKDGISSKVLTVKYTIKKISASGGGGGGGGASLDSKPGVYIITFNLNYEDAAGAPLFQEIKSGDKVSIPTEPVREGFIFKGWTLSRETKELYEFESPVRKNLTLYALWEELISEYKVSFDLNYENAINPEIQVVEEGECVNEPEEPKREGFVFGGWYVDSNYNQLFDFNLPITRDYLLYARWNVINLPDKDEEDNDSGENKEENPKEDIDKDESGETPKEDADKEEEPQPTNDADGDGLSDSFETEILNTNPFIKDTDRNGISDADEDFDNDNLINLLEEKNNCNPYSSDTDIDGLFDYDEINIYGTKPESADTDQDGLLDGDEIKIGLNPFLEKTNEIELDSKRKFIQTLSTQNIAQILLSEENFAIPSLSLKIAGNIDSKIRILPSDSEILKSNTAVLGIPIFITAPSDILFEDAYINFSIDDDSLNQYMICGYRCGKFIPKETIYKEGSISAAIDESGTYFVLNTETFLFNLGINPLDYFYPSASDDIEMQHEAEIVFIIDKTNSMWDSIDHVFYSVDSFLEELMNKRIDARFSIVEYRDITKDGFDSTIQHKNGNSGWWTKDSINEFKDEIKSMLPDGGGDTAETPIDGLAMARNLVTSKTSNKFFILITDAPYKDNNQYGIKNMDEMVELLVSDGINVSLITKEWDYSKEEYDLVGWYLMGDGYETLYRTDIYYEESSAKYFYETLKYDSETGSMKPEKNYVSKEDVGFDIRVGSVAVEDIDGITNTHDVYYDLESAEYYYIKKDFEKSGKEYFREIKITDVAEIVFLTDNKGKILGYKNLYEKTGGLTGNINSDFSSILKNIVVMIENNIDSSCEIILDNYKKIKLKNPLEASTISDTDNDGIYDADELQFSENADLKEYIKTYLNAKNLDFENYVELAGKQSITVWSYKSRPDISDTDGDGVSDKEDKNPKIWDIKDEDLKTVDWVIAESLCCSLSGFDAKAYIKDDKMVIATKGNNDSMENIIKLNLLFPQIKAFVQNIVKRYHGKYDFYVTGEAFGGYLALLTGLELEKLGVTNELKGIITFDRLWLENPTEIFGAPSMDEFDSIIPKTKNYVTN